MSTNGFSRLVLFDIDGTLLHPDGSGRAAVSAALRELYDLPGLEPSYNLGGKIDWQILADHLTPLGHDCDGIRAAMPIFAEAVAHHLRAIIGRHKVQALPGAAKLIADLRQDSRVRLGLVTGNVSAIAPIKLRAAGFDPADFPVGAFGDEAMRRDDLLPLVVRRANAHWTTQFLPEAIWVVGDTPADVISARVVGGRAIAVLTGFSTREALAAEAPYAMLENLNDRAAVEAALFGEMYNE